MEMKDEHACYEVGDRDLGSACHDRRRRGCLCPVRAARSRPQHRGRAAEMPNVVGQGYYDGDYNFNVDRNDKASSPYADGGL